MSLVVGSIEEGDNELKGSELGVIPRQEIYMKLARFQLKKTSRSHSSCSPDERVNFLVFVVSFGKDGRSLNINLTPSSFSLGTTVS